MSAGEEQQAQLLSEYSLALRVGEGQPPAGLEPRLAATVRQIQAVVQPPAPSADFANLLQQRLAVEIASENRVGVASPLTGQPGGQPQRATIWLVNRLATAGLLLLLVVGGLWFAGALADRAQRLGPVPQAMPTLPAYPEAKDAAEVLARAKVLLDSEQVPAFALTRRQSSWSLNPVQLNHADETRLWYQPPNRWRRETPNRQQSTFPGRGNYGQPQDLSYLNLSDGSHQWWFSPPAGEVYVEALSAQQSIVGSLLDIGSSQTILNASGCYVPTLHGVETVAGREAYVVEIGSLSSRSDCSWSAPVGQSGSAPTNIARVWYWFDHDSYFPLKYEVRDQRTGGKMYTDEVTAISYNAPLAAQLFSFTMPANSVAINFNLPPNPATAAPQPDPLVVSSREFAIYLPSYIPVALVPPASLYNDGSRGPLTLSYLTKEESSKRNRYSRVLGAAVMPPLDNRNLLTISQYRVSQNDRDGLQAAEKVAVADAQGWLVRTQSGAEQQTSLIMVRDNTLIDVNSAVYPDAVLVQVAASLKQVAASGPPASAPTITPTATEVPPAALTSMASDYATADAGLPSPVATDVQSAPGVNATVFPPNSDVPAPTALGYMRAIQMVTADEGWAVGGGILHYQHGRWTKVEGLDSSYTFNAIYMVDKDEGWVVGQTSSNSFKGLILHYQHGQWQRESLPANSYILHDVQMTSASEGWAVGGMAEGGTHFGQLLRYSGGKWAAVDCPADVPLRAIQMLAVDEGWAVGDAGTILHYQAGRWQIVAGYGGVNGSNAPLLGPTQADLNDVVMVSASNGWVVGTERDKDGRQHGIVLHYDGKDWQVAAKAASGGLNSISMSWADEGWIVGNAAAGSEQASILHYQAGKLTAQDSPVPGKLRAVRLDAAGGGWIVGDKAILHYQDGRWLEAQSYNNADLFAVQMSSPAEGWASGRYGTILHYQAGAWSVAASPTQANLNSIALVGNEGWIVGSGGTILHLEAGKWVVSDSPSHSHLNKVLLRSPTDGWIVGENGTILHYQAGKWQAVATDSSDTLYDIAMPTADEGWAVGGYGSIANYYGINTRLHPTILHYQAGRWTKYALPDLNSYLTSVYLTSAAEGWAVGTYGTLLRYEQGSWRQVASQTNAHLGSLLLTSAQEGWAVSSGSFASSDGLLHNPLLHYVAGNWQPVEFGVNTNLHALTMLSAREGWAVGGFGLILHYQGGQWSKD